MQPLTPRGYTSRYLSAVQAATNTVSTWLQRGASDEVSSPVAAAAEQLRDEHPFKSAPSEVRTHLTICDPEAKKEPISAAPCSLRDASSSGVQLYQNHL